MRIVTVCLLVASGLALNACALGGAVAVLPGEAIVAREVGYDSYFEQGLDLLAEQICANPERDPVTGNCE